jgi:hypothetical protein
MEKVGVVTVEEANSAETTFGVATIRRAIEEAEFGRSTRNSNDRRRDGQQDGAGLLCHNVVRHPAL